MNAPLKLRVNWEAHVEALPLPTWIISRDTEASQSQNQDVLRVCDQVFLNQACRELLGFTSKDSPSVASWQRYLHPEDRPACLVAWHDFIEGTTPRFSTITRWIRPDTKETISLAIRAQRLLCGPRSRLTGDYFQASGALRQLPLPDRGPTGGAEAAEAGGPETFRCCEPQISKSTNERRTLKCLPHLKQTLTIAEMTPSTLVTSSNTPNRSKS